MIALLAEALDEATDHKKRTLTQGARGKGRKSHLFSIRTQAKSHDGLLSFTPFPGPHRATQGAPHHPTARQRVPNT